MNPALPASLLCAALLALAPASATAKSSDRNQPTSIDAGQQEGSYEGNGTITMSKGVVITQGTLEIHADTGVATMKNGEIVRLVFSGKPATMKQQLDDGSPMDAVADRIEYDVSGDTVTFIGNYTVKSPRGSNSGQRMVYNTKTGNMQSGGDGSRVRTVIQPKTPAPAATK